MLGARPPARPPRTWRAPRKTCLIAATPRSGSNFLCSLLQDANTLGRPREFFNPNSVKPSLRRRPRVMTVRQAMMVNSEGASPNGVASVKLLPRQFDRANNHIDFDRWFPARYWVWQRRADRLGQAISLEIAHQTCAWISHNPEEAIPTYSLESIEQRLNQIDDGEEYWARYFQPRKINVLTVYYEDLVRDPRRTIETIAKHVGEPFSGFDSGLQKKHLPELHVQRTARNDEWRQRYLADKR